MLGQMFCIECKADIRLSKLGKAKTEDFKTAYMNRGMIFSTIWYVRPAKAQNSLRIRAD